VILEAFSKYLQEADSSLSSTEVLARWLWEKLSLPPESNVDRVIHCEIMVCHTDFPNAEPLQLFIPQTDDNEELNYEKYIFCGSSESGIRLLHSLHEYCLSYEAQKWARWVHNVKASHFEETSKKKDS
jgi:hypothetical protein